MANVLEYILKLKDNLSSGLGSVASNANKTFAGMDKGAKNVTRSIDEMQRRIGDLKKTIRFSTDTSAIRQANREISDLERRTKRMQGIGRGSTGAGGGMGGGLMGIMGNPYVQGALAVAGGVGYVGNQYAQKESAITGLSTFLGKQGAAEAYTNVKKDADVTPYSIESLLQVNRALISAGASAAEARNDALGLANAIAATGGGNDELMRMAANMQQIKTVGVATAADIKQFGYAGINIYKILADYTGKNVEQVKEMEVSYNVLADALNHAAQQGGAFAGALEAQGQTLSGKWSTFMDQLQGTAQDIGDFLSPVLKKVLQVATEVVDFWRLLFKNMGAIMQNNAGWLRDKMAYIGDLMLISLKIKGLEILAWADELGRGIYNSISSAISGISGGLIDIAPVSTTSSLRDNISNLNKQKEMLKYGDSLDSESRKQINRQLMGFEKTGMAAVGANLVKPSNRGMGFAGATDPTSSKHARAAANKVDTISGGGARNVYITLGKFQENLNIYTSTVKEGVNEMEEMVTNTLLRILNSANLVTN